MVSKLPSTSSTLNWAAFVVERLLQVKRPVPKEPAAYVSQAEALTVLRRTAHLTREVMAFRLGISIPMLDKAEAGSHGGNLQLTELELARTVALECNLPVMAEFFYRFHTHARRHAKRGPKRNSPTEWWKDPEQTRTQG